MTELNTLRIVPDTENAPQILAVMIMGHKNDSRILMLWDSYGTNQAKLKL